MFLVATMMRGSARELILLVLVFGSLSWLLQCFFLTTTVFLSGCYSVFLAVEVFCMFFTAFLSFLFVLLVFSSCYIVFSCCYSDAALGTGAAIPIVLSGCYSVLSGCYSVSGCFSVFLAATVMRGSAQELIFLVLVVGFLLLFVVVTVLCLVVTVFFCLLQ